MSKRLQRTRWLFFVSISYGWLWACSALAGASAAADTCQHPAPPVLSSSAVSVCRYDSVMLSATGCAGTVVWSTGEFGSGIRVRPQQTTTYTAICRLEPGCISCFAEPLVVTVNTPAPPALTASNSRVCPGYIVSLTATQCAGLVRWSDQSTGPVWTGKLDQNTSFRATCEQNDCMSSLSKPVLVEVNLPTVPVIQISTTEVCAGQPVALSASNCLGTVRWSDGGEGLSRIVRPIASVQYTAVCETGSCRSERSVAVGVQVRPATRQLDLATSLTNTCPYQTADLTRSISEGKTVPVGIFYAFRTKPDLEAAPVQTPVAVLAGTYYVYGYTTDGCYTEPVAVSIMISPCENAIPPCQSNPASVQASLVSIDWQAGVAQLNVRLGGVAKQTEWQSTGNGLFTGNGTTTRYLLSEADLKTKAITFTVSTPDPDGAGPCTGASDRLITTHSLDDKRGTSALGQQVKQVAQTLQTTQQNAQTDEEPTSIFIPEGFSPNGDGVNDLFVIRYVPAGVSVRLDIYNRWGNRVYHRENYQNDWDGTANEGMGVPTGKGLPDGTYFYQVTLSTGQEFTRFVTLVR